MLAGACRSGMPCCAQCAPPHYISQLIPLQSEGRHYGEASCRDYRLSVLAALPHRCGVQTGLRLPAWPLCSRVDSAVRGWGLCALSLALLRSSQTAAQHCCPLCPAVRSHLQTTEAALLHSCWHLTLFLCVFLSSRLVHSWHSPYDTKLVPMRFEKTKAGTGAQKQQLGKMGALKTKQVSSTGVCAVQGQWAVRCCCMSAVQH